MYGSSVVVLIIDGVFWLCEIGASVRHFRPATVLLYISIIIQTNSLQNLHEGPKAVPRDRKIGPGSPLPDFVSRNSPIARFCPPTCPLHFGQSFSPSLFPSLFLS